MKNPLTIHSDSSESLHYNIQGLPLYTQKDQLSHYDYKALIHWHPDLEFIYIETGKMDFYINGEIVHLYQGQGVFINSQRLHYGFSDTHDECDFLALVISPDIINHNAPCTKEYMHHKFGLKNTDYLLLSNQISWQKEILDTIITIHQSIQNPNRPLYLICKAIEIIDMIGEHIHDYQDNNNNSLDQDLFIKMTTWINEHYNENITIATLCHKVGISRNKCCHLFQQFTQNTFQYYLSHYRLNKSLHYLKNTHLSILEISQLCGFSSPSYFTSVFKKEYHCLPKEMKNI